MYLTADTTEALAIARNEGRSLVAVKRNEAPKTREADTGTGTPTIGSILESIAAVVPTGITAVYTVVGGLLWTEMTTRGSAERAAVQKALLDKKVERAEIDEKLAAMPLQAKDFIELRWAFLGLAAVVAVVVSFRAVHRANKKSTNKRSPIRLALEPTTALIAFVGWSLAVPGTPLGAYLSASDMTVVSAVIAGAGGLLLLALGVDLTKPAVVTPAAGTPDGGTPGGGTPGGGSPTAAAAATVDVG